MSNSIFPTLPGLAWSITKSPQFDTVVQRAVSGKEIRRANRTRPLWHFSLSFEVLRNYQTYTEYQQLVAFFNARMGSFDSFLLLDDSDKTATNQPCGVGDGVTRTFPLVHTIQGWTEPIGYSPAPAVSLNGVGTGAFTSDGSKITFTTPPASGVAIAWTGTFYYRVRFEKDILDFEQFMKDFWLLKKCEMVGVI